MAVSWWPAKGAKACAAVATAVQAVQRRTRNWCTGAPWVLLTLWLLYAVLPPLSDYSGHGTAVSAVFTQAVQRTQHTAGTAGAMLAPAVHVPGMTALLDRLQQLPSKIPGWLQFKTADVLLDVHPQIGEKAHQSRPAQAPRQAEAQATMLTLAQAPRLAPAQTPRQVQVRTPRQVHAKTNSQAQAHMPRQVQAQRPRLAQAHTVRQVQTNAKAQRQVQAQRKGQEGSERATLQRQQQSHHREQQQQQQQPYRKQQEQKQHNLQQERRQELQQEQRKQQRQTQQQQQQQEQQEQLLHRAQHQQQRRQEEQQEQLQQHQQQHQQHQQQPEQRHQQVPQTVVYPPSCLESPMLPSCELPEFTLVADGGDLDHRLWQVCSGYAIRLGLRDMGWATGVRVLWVTGPGEGGGKGRVVEGVKGPGAESENGSANERNRGTEVADPAFSGVSVAGNPFERLFQPMGIVRSVPPSSPLFRALLEPFKRTVTVPSCKEEAATQSPSMRGSAPPTGGRGKEGAAGGWAFAGAERGIQRATRGLNFTVFVSPRHVNFVTFDAAWACSIQKQFRRCFRSLNPTKALLSLPQAGPPHVSNTRRPRPA